MEHSLPTISYSIHYQRRLKIVFSSFSKNDFDEPHVDKKQLQLRKSESVNEHMYSAHRIAKKRSKFITQSDYWNRAAVWMAFSLEEDQHKSHAAWKDVVVNLSFNCPCVSSTAPVIFTLRNCPSCYPIQVYC